MYIDNQADFESFIGRAGHSSYLAIDTEFLREKTYYPKLCLIQIATEEEIAIIDPFTVDDYAPFGALLGNQNIVKIFHAASQDIEILFNETGVMPDPIFDTQVAAALLGHTQQIGYGALVLSQCKVNLKKKDSFTDWSKRPLKRSQIDYAADDVIYLPRIYEAMTKELTAKGRLTWLTPDFKALSNPAKYNVDPRERYVKLKRSNQLSARQLSAAREVAAWRELKARKRNIPRKWVLADEQVVEACKREARTLDELFMVRGMQEKLSTKDARDVVDALITGLDLPQEEWPKVSRRHKNEFNVDIQIDLMNALVRLRSRENDIAPQTLASHNDLVEVARKHYDTAEVLKGWRREIVGNDLVDLTEGRIVLSIDEGKLNITRK